MSFEADNDLSTVQVGEEDRDNLWGKTKNQDCLQVCVILYKVFTAKWTEEGGFNQPLHTPCDFNLWPSRLLERRNVM